MRYRPFLEGLEGRLVPAANVAPLPAGIVGSVEYYGRLVDETYGQLLFRAPTAAERNYWVTNLAAGRTTDERFTAGLLGGIEFSFGHNPPNATDPVWIDSVYVNVLGRFAEDFGLAAWKSALRSGASREAVALAICTSDEAEGNYVDHTYRAFLGRPASAPERDAWVELIEYESSRVTRERFSAAVASSPEAFAHVNSDVTAYINLLYREFLGRAPDAGGFAHFAQVAAGI